MKYLESCIKLDKLKQFENDIFSLEVEGLSGLEKQVKLTEFINKYAPTLKLHFCENICGEYYRCNVYKSFKKKER